MRSVSIIMFCNFGQFFYTTMLCNIENYYITGYQEELLATQAIQFRWICPLVAYGDVRGLSLIGTFPYSDPGFPILTCLCLSVHYVCQTRLLIVRSDHRSDQTNFIQIHRYTAATQVHDR